MLKLSREQVEKMVDMALDKLKNEKLIVFKAKEDDVREKMIATFMLDLKKEDDLDNEVEELLDSQPDSVDGEKVDHRKMFGMIKGKLAKERGIVI